MSSIVTSILSSTVGLLWNKTRDKTAESLKDGDITDAKLREIVVRELNDIKTKLDGLSRKDLLSSYSFLQEGIQLLNVCLEKFEQKAVVNEGNDDRGETSRMSSHGESDILNEALQLSQALGKLQIVSKELESAKERFKDARKRATDAFCNEGLNIQDRIFAAKLRVVSEILECLDNPDTAASSCLLFLGKLHGLPAVREIFSVYLDRGVKSFFKKTERAENVKSVMMINYVLYRFVSKLSSKYCSALAWPTIQLSDRSFNPICSWEEISTRKSWGEGFIQPPNLLKRNESIAPYLNSAVNSRGEIVSISRISGDITVISRTGTTKLSFPTEDKKARVIEREVLSVGVNEENDVYLVIFEKTSENLDGHVALYILDEHYTRVKHKSTLRFLSKFWEFRFQIVKMAVNKNNIVITPALCDDQYVYICDNTGQLKHKFVWERIEQQKLANKMISISDKNEVILAVMSGNNVDLYTEEGKRKMTLELPAGHLVHGVAFHFIVRKIIVLSRLMYVSSPRKYSFFLHCYSETGKLENSTFLGKKLESYIFEFAMTSHPSGPVAVVEEQSITYV